MKRGVFEKTSDEIAFDEREGCHLSNETDETTDTNTTDNTTNTTEPVDTANPGRNL